MSSMRRYSSGDKFRPSAEQVNSWTDAAAAYKKTRGGTGLDREKKSLQNATRFPVLNSTEDDLPFGSVLQLSNTIDPTVSELEYKSAIAFTGEQVSTNDEDKIAILQQWTAAGNEDPNAVVSGVAMVRLEGADSKAKATPVNGQYTLTTGATGPCVILYDPGPSGEERLGVVRIDGGGGDCTCSEIHEFYCSPAPTSGTFSVTYDFNGTSDTVTWDYNDDWTAVKTAFDAHSNSSAVSPTVTGGPWPSVALYVTFNQTVDFPTVDNSSLSGGKGFMRKFSTAG